MEAMPLTSKLLTRVRQSWDFISLVAMTTTALSSCFFIQKPQTSPGKILASHKWASILSPRQDLNWTSNKKKKMCTNLSRVLNPEPTLNVFWRGTQMEIFFISSKTQSEAVSLVITFMYFLQGLNNGKIRKNKNILQSFFFFFTLPHNLQSGQSLRTVLWQGFQARVEIHHLN